MDEPRLLHRRSQYGYTRVTILALSAEPEAVSDDEQWLISRRAHDLELRAWEVSRRRLLEEIEHIRAHVKNPHVERTARAWVREIEALDRKLMN